MPEWAKWYVEHAEFTVEVAENCDSNSNSGNQIQHEGQHRALLECDHPALYKHFLKVEPAFVRIGGPHSEMRHHAMWFAMGMQLVFLPARVTSSRKRALTLIGRGAGQIFKAVDEFPTSNGTGVTSTLIGQAIRERRRDLAELLRTAQLLGLWEWLPGGAERAAKRFVPAKRASSPSMRPVQQHLKIIMAAFHVAGKRPTFTNSAAGTSEFEEIASETFSAVGIKHPSRRQIRNAVTREKSVYANRCSS